jgi:hypothetical protein
MSAPRTGSVPVSWLVERLTEAAQADLRTVAERVAASDDMERKRQLLLHLHGTRQRLLRLLVLTRWSVQVRHRDSSLFT